VPELTATRVLVVPGADVLLLPRGKIPAAPARVVGPCRCHGTGQDGVCVEGPEPGAYACYTLEAFARLFGPAQGPPPGKAAGYISEGSGC
jgi:hypothetical protein